MNNTYLAWAAASAFLCLAAPAFAADSDGLSVSLNNVDELHDVQSRSISAENFTGEPGHGGMATHGTGGYASRELGVGWKVSPSILITAHSNAVLADITGP